MYCAHSYARLQGTAHSSSTGGCALRTDVGLNLFFIGGRLCCRRDGCARWGRLLVSRALERRSWLSADTLLNPAGTAGPFQRPLCVL
jgi:hypothetical protein